MKRIVSTILVATFLVTTLCIAPVSVNAAQQTGGDYLFSVTDGTVEIVQYIGDDKDVDIPSTLGGYSVTKIGKKRFMRHILSKMLKFQMELHLLHNTHLKTLKIWKAAQCQTRLPVWRTVYSHIVKGYAI